MKKTLKYIARFFIVALILLGLFVTLMLMPIVQTFVAKKMIDRFNPAKAFNISFDYMDVSPLNQLIVHRLLIRDHHHDTLIYAEKILATYHYAFNENKIYLHLASLDLPVFKLITYNKEQETNLDKWLMQLASKDTTDTSASEIPLKIQKILIHQGRFCMWDYNFPKQENLSLIDFNYLTLDKINLIANRPDFFSDTIEIPVERLTASEKSGLIIRHLQTFFKLSQSGLVFDKTILKTNNTFLKGDIQLQTTQLSDFSDFFNSVYINSDIDTAKIAISDLNFFTQLPENFSNQQIHFKSRLRGTLGNLKLKNMNLSTGHLTYVTGNVKISGLPELDKTLIIADIDQFSTTSADVQSMHLIDLPNKEWEKFHRISPVTYHGQIHGFLNDITVFGSLKCSAGNVKMDINVKNKNDLLTVKGNLKSGIVNLHKYDPTLPVGKMSFIVDANFNYKNKHDFSSKISGRFDALEFNRYTYQNIELDGELSNQKYTGKLTINDPNLVLNYNGEIDFMHERPILNFYANIVKIKPAAINFPLPDTSVTLSAKVNINTKGLEVNTISGEIEINDLLYLSENDSFVSQTISIVFDQFNKNRVISLTSNELVFHFTGSYIPEHLPEYFQYTLHQFLPDYFSIPKKLKNDTVFDLRFTIEADTSINQPLHLFVKDFYLKKMIKIHGSIIHGKFNAKVDPVDFIVLNKMVDNFRLNVNTSGNYLLVNSGIGSIKIDDSLSVDNIRFDSKLFNNNIQGRLRWQNNDSIANLADINFGLRYLADSVYFKLDSSLVVVNDRKWDITSYGWSAYTKHSIFVDSLKATDRLGEILINGNTVDRTNPLKISIKKFDINYLASFDKGLQTLKGFLNTQQTIYQKDTLYFNYGQLSIDSFQFSEIYIGEVAFQNEADQKNQMFKAQGEIIKDNKRVLELFAFMKKTGEQVKMNHQIKFKEAEFKLLEPYLTGVFSNLGGQLEGEINITGTIKEPVLVANLVTNNIKLKVDYLQTSYTIPGKNNIQIEPDWIGFNNVRIYDEKNNSAILNANILHKNLKNFNFDIGLFTDKFLFINTKAEHNTTFYGTAYAKGVVNISGFEDKIMIEANVTTLHNTQLNLPLSNPEEVSEFGFVNFINVKEEVKGEKHKIEEDQGPVLTMNFDVTVTPEAEFRMIFDEKVGDILRARGSGRINLQIDENGTFRMFGDYVVEEGDYLFTMQNLVNKKFIIEKGGEISWNGDPLDGNINLYATYKTRAALATLLNDSSQQFKKKVPVNVRMHLLNQLAQPDVEFEIELPTIDATTRQRVNAILYAGGTAKNNPLITQQVFSLLVLNRFVPMAGNNTATGEGNAGLQSGTELLSNQVSNWLNQFSNQIDFGLSYRKGSRSQQDEVELAMSTQLFNDRIVIDGSVGYVNAQNTQANTLVGDVSVEYKLTEDGKARIKAFNRSNNNNLNANVAPYTQGIGFIYRIDFFNLRDLFKKNNQNEN